MSCPSKVWGVQDAPLRRYKRLKNEITWGYYRTFSILYKYFYYRWWFFEKFLWYLDSTCQALALTSKKKILNIFSNFFIKANFEILTSDLEIRPKITVQTFQSLRGPGWPFWRYKQLKNVISICDNRKFFNNLKISI